jgi:4-carboxymuconolactone decarboxylase
MPAKKLPLPRLAVLPEEELDAAQRKLMDSLRSGPRGKSVQVRGPFAVYLHAPDYGELVQELGAHVRFSKRVPARLSEFAILVTAKFWRAQYEWHMHAIHAATAGVKPQTIKDLQAGRTPKSAPKDEMAIYDYIKELYKTKRVSDRNYKRVHAILGDAGMVEFVGILGYYVLVAMTLNVFRMPPPTGEPLPFPE